MKFEKKLKIQLTCGFLWICLGILACVAAFSGKVSSGYPLTYCAGTGGGLIAISFIHIIKSIRLLKNESLRKKEEIRIYDERNIFIQKQIYSLHSLFSLVLLYVATLWAALWKPELLIPFLLLMLTDVALLFLAAIYCNIRNSCE